MVSVASVFPLAGLPILAGLVSKFYVFTATAAQGWLWLMGLAIFMSLVSLYYYPQAAGQLHMVEPADPDPIRPDRLKLGCRWPRWWWQGSTRRR